MTGLLKLYSKEFCETPLVLFFVFFFLTIFKPPSTLGKVVVPAFPCQTYPKVATHSRSPYISHVAWLWFSYDLASRSASLINTQRQLKPRLHIHMEWFKEFKSLNKWQKPVVCAIIGSFTWEEGKNVDTHVSCEGQGANGPSLLNLFPEDFPLPKTERVKICSTLLYELRIMTHLMGNIEDRATIGWEFN